MELLGWRLGIHHHLDGKVTVLLMQVEVSLRTTIQDRILGRHRVLMIINIRIHLLYHTTNIKHHEMLYLPATQNDTLWCHNLLILDVVSHLIQMLVVRLPIFRLGKTSISCGTQPLRRIV